MLVRPLAGNHDRQAFDCGRQELNDWLRQVARQHQDKGLSKTFVAVREEEPTRICGYYALTLAELDNRHMPDTWRKKLPGASPACAWAAWRSSRNTRAKRSLNRLKWRKALRRGSISQISQISQTRHRWGSSDH